MKRILAFGLLAFAVASVTHGTPYWVAWEGNDYPENEGWERVYGNWNGVGEGEAHRTLENGVLRIESLFDDGIYDYLRIDQPGAFSLSPGETFITQWRTRVNESHGFIPLDAGMALFSDDDWGLGLKMGVSELRSSFEGIEIPYAPSEFHAFEMTTSDFRSYTLYLDGEHVLTGSFWEPAVTRSYVAWGDGVQGVTSDCEWDYFRFGIVPEPDTCVALLVSVFILAIRRRRARVTGYHDPWPPPGEDFRPLAE